MACIKAVSAVLGCSIIFFCFGLYFCSGSLAIYLISYLRLRTQSRARHEHSLWFFAAVSVSALLLPLGGIIRRKIGLRAVCSLAGFIQTLGILLTYLTLDLNFPLVVLTYGGSFLFSFGLAYTSTIVNCSMWCPNRKGLATGIVCATMALAPTLWTPLLTSFINPNNIKVSEDGYFHDEDVLNNIKDSILLQAFISFILFTVGVLLLFPAHKEQSLDEENDCAIAQSEEKKAFTNNEEPAAIGLSPKEAVKTDDFYLLSFKLMITELIFYYLLFVYKPFGQTFIKNDQYLSLIGALAAIGNTTARLVVGYLKDIIKYKFCCIPLSGLATILILLIPFTVDLHPFFYSVFMIGSIALIGSQYALMPSAITDTFGETYASENIGYVYYSTVLANLVGALGSQFLTKFLGWRGMIWILGLVALIDFLVNFLLPTDPVKKLEKRVYKRDYLKNKLESVLICPHCKYSNCTLGKCTSNQFSN